MWKKIATCVLVVVCVAHAGYAEGKPKKSKIKKSEAPIVQVEAEKPVPVKEPVPLDGLGRVSYPPEKKVFSAEEEKSEEAREKKKLKKNLPLTFLMWFYGATPVRPELSLRQLENFFSLTQSERKRLEDIRFVMLDDELHSFLNLTESVERETFFDEWNLIRSYDIDGRRVDFMKEVYPARLQYVNDHYMPGDDRAMTLILHGMPLYTDSCKCNELVANEIWYYKFLPGIGSDVALVFYRRLGLGSYRWFRPTSNEKDLLNNDASSRMGPGDAGAQAPDRIGLERISWDRIDGFCPDTRALRSALQKTRNLFGDRGEKEQLLFAKQVWWGRSPEEGMAAIVRNSLQFSYSALPLNGLTLKCVAWMPTVTNETPEARLVFEISTSELLTRSVGPLESYNLLVVTRSMDAIKKEIYESDPQTVRVDKAEGMTVIYPSVVVPLPGDNAVIGLLWTDSNSDPKTQRQVRWDGNLKGAPACP